MSGTGKLTYHDFVQRVSHRADCDAAALDRFLHRLGPAVETALANEGKVSLSGFGHFDLRHIDERLGRNLQTGKTISIPEHSQIHFTPFKALKWSVNWPYRSGVIHMLPPPQHEDRVWNRPWILPTIGALIFAMLCYLGFRTPGVRPIARNPSVLAVAAPVVVPVLPVLALPVTPQPAEPAAAPMPEASPVPMHTAVLGDSFWLLATQVWQAPSWWPLLYVENRAQLPVMDPDQLPVGTQLHVPTLDGSPAAPSDGDLERLTAAYSLVGQDYQQQNNPRSTSYLSVARQGFRP